MVSQLPVLQPRMLFGIQTQVKDNVHFLSDEEIVYPVGAVLCVNNLTQKKQKFIRLAEKGSNVSRIIVSPNK